MGCHGNYQISYNPNGLIFEASILACLWSQLALWHPKETFIGTKGSSTITNVPLLVIAYFLLSNDFPVIFQVFLNVHEYENEIIYIWGHWMKELVELYHLLYNIYINDRMGS